MRSGIRYLGYDSFRIGTDRQIFVTNKYGILSAPRDWVEDVGLSQLRTAMSRATDDKAKTLYISSDAPDRFDAKYPNHLLDVHLKFSEAPSRMTVGVEVERPEADESDEDREVEIRQLLTGVMRRHRGSEPRIERHAEHSEYATVYFDVPVRGKTTGEALRIGAEAEAVLAAASGGQLDLRATVDLVRGGHAGVLVGQPEGRWFDGKRSPYVLSDEAGKWELAKDVAAFANSEAGGLIVIGARTERRGGSDVVTSISDVDLSRVKLVQYRALVRARVQPRVEGLEILAVDHGGEFGVAFIYVPPQREEGKPFVVKGTVSAGKMVANHVSIPTRDGEETRYSDPAEIHALLQIGRAVLRGRRPPPGEVAQVEPPLAL